MRLLKRAARCAAASVVALLFGAVVNGQSVQISSDAYYQAVARYQSSTDGVAYKEITRTEHLRQGIVEQTREVIREWDKDRNHRVLTKDTRPDGSVSSESIWIGPMEYHREGNGSWTKTDWSRRATGGSGGTSSDITRYSVEEIHDGPVRQLLFIREVTRVTPKSKTIDVTKTLVNQFYWRQREEQIESVDTMKNVVKRSVTTFDYNPGKIELKPPIN